MIRLSEFKKRQRRLLSLVLTLSLLAGLMPSGGLVTYADSEPVPFQFITDVSITEEDGTAFEGPVNKDSKLRLQYEFAIPDTEVTTGSVASITAGQIYTFSIPQEIPVINQMSIPLKDGDENVFANVVIGTDNKGAITFTDLATQLSGVTGYFWVYSKFYEDKIGNDGEQNIIFDLGNGASKVVTVQFEEEVETSDIKLVKSGVYDSVKNEITWTIKIKPETTPNLRDLSNVIIKDVIADNQTYIDSSAKISPEVSGGIFKYDETSKELSFAFNQAINKIKGEEYILTFNTKPEITGFTENNQTLFFKNIAKAQYKDVEKPKDSDSNEAQVDIKSNFIKKEGKLSGFEYIDWTVTVNNNSFSIKNAKITDKLPAGLTLDKSSIKLDGISVTPDDATGPLKYDEATRILTYEFGVESIINAPKTLTYRTKVTDPEAFKSNTPKIYTNEAELTGYGVPVNTKEGVGVTVPTSVIKKEGVGYNRASQEITWKITVNKNKIPMTGAVVTDSIPAGLEYVAGSFSVKDDVGSTVTPSPGEFIFDGPSAGEHHRGIFTYKIPDSLTTGKTVTIEFKTKVMDNNLYATNKTTNFTNKAVLNYTGGPKSDSSATQEVKSEVISKRSLGYNYNTREIEWEITVNQNKMPLSNVTVTDVIPAGHKYVEASSTMDDVTISPVYDASTNILTYNVGSINTDKKIKFKTQVVDLSIFEDNKTITVKNIAKITAGKIPGEVTVTGNRNISNTVVGKKGVYTNGNNFIDWEVTVNQNGLEIQNPVLEDVLQEGLSLDTASVKLFKAERASNGSLTKGEEVLPLDENNIKYNGPSRNFEFHFNKTIDSPYILEFRTDIEDAYRSSTFTNTISFKGSRPTQESTSSNIAVSFQTGGGGASGSLGSITVEKLDKETNAKLEGAKFQLIDSFGNVLSEKITDSNGKIIFDKLKFRTYTVKEVAAPEGYILNFAPQTLTVNSSNKNITVKAQNSAIKGNIEFRKIDSQTKDPIEGATFELFKESGPTMGITAISGTDGLVAFKDIPYGVYTIKEKSPAKYYKDQAIELKANISEDKQEVFASPSGNAESLYDVENTINTGNLKLIKVDKNNNQIKLQDATFRLFRLQGENEVLESEKTTDENGLAVWENLRFGKYVLREVVSPDGYYINADKVDIEISDDKLKGSDTLDISFDNEKIPLGNLVINKIDSYSAKPIENVEFEIYKVSNLEIPIKKVITDIDGKAEITGLQIGDYLIKEVNTPSGYHKLKVDQIVTIEDSKATSVTIKNDPLRSIIVKKVDKNNPTLLLPGAVFSLRNGNNENVGENLITGQDGKVVFNLLEFGNYKLKEITAPSGYLLNDLEITITIDNDSELAKIIEVTNQKRPSGGGGGGNPPTEPEPPVITPEIPVTPELPESPELPAVPEPPSVQPEIPQIPEFVIPPAPADGPDKFILINENGVERGIYSRVKTPDGEYIYIDEYGSPLGSPGIPQTGDESHSGMWMLLMAACLAGSGLLMRPARKKSEQ